MTTIIRPAIGSLSSKSIIDFFIDNDISVIETDITEKSYCSEIANQYFIVSKAEEDNVINMYLKICKKTNANWICKKPANGIESCKWNKIIGTNATQSYKADDLIKRN